MKYATPNRYADICAPVLGKYNKEVGERTVISMYVALSQLRASQAARSVSAPVPAQTVVASRAKTL